MFDVEDAVHQSRVHEVESLTVSINVWTAA